MPRTGMIAALLDPPATTTGPFAVQRPATAEDPLPPADAGAPPGPERGDGGAGFVEVEKPSDPSLAGILVGYAWAGAITYGDPAQAADYQDDYPGHVLRGFQRLSASQRATVHAALSADPEGQPVGGLGYAVESFTNLGVDYAGAGGAGTIRLANSSAPSGAFGYYPGGDVTSGDVFFNTIGRAPVVGERDYLTVFHELGHALGLKHGHEYDRNPPLPADRDSMEFTAMTYRSHVGGAVGGYTNEAFGFAQSWMMLDIAALQHLYGADYGAHAGDTTYRWNPATGAHSVDGALAWTPGANRVFHTVWDGGGTDTYDLAAYATDLSVDLRPGMHSTFAQAQLAFLGGGPNGGFARGNVFNALLFGEDPRSLIENAIGGSGDDALRGNAAGNRLGGREGDDALDGYDGDDVLNGGNGADTLRGGGGDDALSGGSGSDVLDGGPGADRMAGGAGNDIYHVDVPGDATVEAGGSTVDLVIAGASHSLAAGIENLTLRGSAAEGRGNSLANALTGTDGANVLVGGKGADQLRGRDGNDTLLGEFGGDRLLGGAGGDRFLFHSADQSSWSAFDVILAQGSIPAMQGIGVAGGDGIDLALVDANAGAAGDQAFVWGSASVGGLSVVEAGNGVTRVQGNVSAAPGFEFRIEIEDGATLAAAYRADDFAL